MAGTQRGGAAGLFDGFGRTRQAGTGHDRDAAADALDRAGQQQVVLGIGEGRRFAGRAGYDNAMDATFQLQMQQALPTVGIEGAVGPERGRQRGDEAGKGQGRAALGWEGKTPATKGRGRPECYLRRESTGKYAGHRWIPASGGHSD
ncbi:hypothetical protein G6F22_016231 [Rhizopus arrhizus]|nr:hypothetical protein G6F22_016231 [Rhizopus arrhizus]